MTKLFNIYGFSGGSFAGNVYDVNGLAPCINVMEGGNRQPLIVTDMEQGTLQNELGNKKFRVRKLTPRECFRLMGVEEADIDKIQAAGISKSAQYKLAGNSIVVDVLYYIFENLFIKEIEPQTLFDL